MRLKQILSLKEPQFKFEEKTFKVSKTLFGTDIILLLLSVAPIKGKTKLQKQVFLAWKEFLYDKIDELGYFPYRYGAYSRLVDDSTKTLFIQNKIQMKKRKGEGTIYSITKKGKYTIFKNIRKRKKSYSRFLKTKNKYGEKLEDKKIDWDDWSAKGILRYVYRNFPEYTTKTRVPSLKW